MNKKVLALALAASAVALPVLSMAQSADQGAGGFFINGQVGRSDLSKGIYDDSDTGYGANVGYRWAINPNVALGVEGGYTKLGSFDPKSAYNGAGFGRADVKGWNLGVNGHFNLTPNWYVSARGGLFRGDVEGDRILGSAPTPSGNGVIYDVQHIDDTSNKYYAGVGFGYDFSRNVSVGLNYDYYKTEKNDLKLDPSLVSVSAEYRF
jgi:OOP family OmpA-OmpF porin/outer membrane immunogenic protein